MTPLELETETLGPRGASRRERVIAKKGPREVRHVPAYSVRVTGPWGAGWRRLRASCELHDAATGERKVLFTGAAWIVRLRECADEIAKFLGVSRREALTIDPMTTTLFDGEVAP